MVDFVRLAATAERLIEANGRDVSVIKVGSAPADVNKPWRGPADPRDTLVETLVAGRAVFVPPTGETDFGFETTNEENTKRDRQICLFAANNDGGESLQDFDEILDGGARWQIEQTRLLRPAGVKILYAFMVAQ